MPRRKNDMVRKKTFVLALALALAAVAGAASAVQPTATKKAREAKPEAVAGTPIEYVDLETQVGAEIAVETTLNTVRRGVLLKYTGPALTIQLGPQLGSIDFTVPRETVRNITLIAPAGAPAAKDSGSAQKN